MSAEKRLAEVLSDDRVAAIEQCVATLDADPAGPRRLANFVLAAI